MMLDNIERAAFKIENLDVAEKLGSFHKGFDSKVAAKEGVYVEPTPESKYQLSRWLGVEEGDIKESSFVVIQSTIKQMYEGVDLPNGERSRGLKEIGEMKVNPDYEYQNLRQQSGFSAEVVSTAKENIVAELKGSGVKTFRADDRPDLFPRNDQYVDKIREYPDGTVERIQVKFVGDNGAECLDKLMSKKYDKYFEGDHVDKIEIPKDHYKEIRQGKLIETKRADLQNQLAHVTEEGNIEAAQKLEAKIERLNKVDAMLEKSNTSTKEAMFARQHPKAYTTLQFSNQAGIEAGIGAATITAAVSTVDNIRAVKNGEMTPLEAFGDVAKDTGTAGALGYGTGFVSTAVAQTMSQSSHQLIQSMGNAGVPGAVISFGIASYDSVTDFAQGNIGGRELAYDLGGDALGVAGSIVGSGLATAAVGSVVPGVGTVGGFAVGVVGGMVGYAVTTEAYRTAVDYGSEHAGVLADKAKSFASETLETVKAEAPDKVDSVRSSINSFASAHALPFQL